jgi:hypothetical protein
MHLAGHFDSKTHIRYVMQVPAMRAIPAAALPRLPASAGPIVGARDDSKGPGSHAPVIPARPARLERTTRGLEEAGRASQNEELCGVATGERVEDAHRDPACFSVRQDDSSPNVTGGFGPDRIELALAKTLEAVAEAGRFEVVAQLAKELEARRGGRSRPT